jgi:GT2 family glycosyltransferase
MRPRADRVEVVVAHRNDVPKLRKLLTALRAQTVPCDVCVVDDASTDDTPRVVPAEFPEVRYERLERNLGFSGANNHGIRTSTADVLFLLNNDTVPEPGCVEAVLAARARTGAEMVAVCLRKPDGTIDSAGIEVNRSLVAFDLLHGEAYDPEVVAALEPLAPCAGAGAYDRGLLERVGGFDEAMFAYLEDVELGIRLRMAGARCAVARDTFVWHEHSSFWGSGSARKNDRMGHSRGYVLWKYRNDLTPVERLRGLLIDGVVYAGQVAIDRNAGALRGRWRGRRERGGAPAPASHAEFAAVPRASVSVRASLSRRLSRRRPAAATPAPASPPSAASPAASPAEPAAAPAPRTAR